MNRIQSLVATDTIALVSITSLPIALPETVNPAAITREPAQMMAERPASFKPGIFCKPYLLLMAIAPKIKTPTLMVHSDGSALTSDARKFYSALAEKKHCELKDNTSTSTIAIRKLQRLSMHW